MLSAPVLPATFRPAARAVLEEFFAAPEIGAPGGTFALAGPAQRAQLVATLLCGPEPAQLLAKLGSPPGPAAGARRRRRVLLTGCFDIMHAGHYNALRQAKAVFPGEDVTLVAGVHSDDAIERAKGAPTVLTHAERHELVAACRWVDEVVGDLPYEVPVSLLDRLDCDVAVHGDDLPASADGGGLLDEVMAAGRLRIVKRTEGTSTTTLIGRLLSASKDHLLSRTAADRALPSAPRLISEEATQRSPDGGSAPDSAPLWMLLPTMSRMVLFYGNRPPRSLCGATRVVYAPGEWDLFHVGHVRFLQRARALGDFLLVGCYEDSTIHRKKGRNYPLQTLHERALNVLACRHVDDVLLGAPWVVTKDLLTTLNVTVVATGSNNVHRDPLAEGAQDPFGMGDPFQELRQSDVLQILPSACELTMDVIAERICDRTALYAQRQAAKLPAERAYNEGKTFMAES